MRFHDESKMWTCKEDFNLYQYMMEKGTDNHSNSKFWKAGREQGLWKEIRSHNSLIYRWRGYVKYLTEYDIGRIQAYLDRGHENGYLNFVSLTPNLHSGPKAMYSVTKIKLTGFKKDLSSVLPKSELDYHNEIKRSYLEANNKIKS